MDSNNIRKVFLEFFADKGHTIRPSSPLVPPPDDPTLLFTTAGMVQFKPLWAGAPLPFKRAATVQKCLRAGGKGSDLENVGKTLRHHTFFEMLGNFSFGDYFKQEAILWAWELVTEVFRMPEDCLWVSVFREDDEAFSIWKDKIGLPEGRIIRLGEKDNFWGPAGKTGACGPCSEIYFDLGPQRGCGKADCKPGCDCERFLEFWNLVFPQYYQEEDGSRRELERRGIDTGMGLERLAFLLQTDADNNYETDLFKPIIAEIKDIAPAGYEGRLRSSFHVIADHIRALVFAISENIVPSNEGRGYVLRRLLRRAVRYGRKIGIKEPFLHRLVGVVVGIMGDVYPELVQMEEFARKIILTEEEKFQQTLDYGLYMLEEIVERLKEKNKDIIDGSDIFRLYDTYGFPLDIMEEVAGEYGVRLDFEGFERCMEEQKQRAKRSWIAGIQKRLKPVYSEIQNEIEETEFVGYDRDTEVCQLVAIIKGDNRVKGAGQNEQVEMVFDRTPFYPESGGQVGDTGTIEWEGGFGKVLDTYYITHRIIAHKVEIIKGRISTGCSINAVIDRTRRQSIRRHHTGTHLLQYALRSVLGDHIKQSGSYVGPDKLRFDFSHFAQPDSRQLDRIAGIVNEKIYEGAPVKVYTKRLSEALKEGVLAFFGEKYGDTVRVVNIGDFSKELCGGTHVENTSQIGCFVITYEGSVAAGVRRIEALCGIEAVDYLKRRNELLISASSLVKALPEQLPERISGIIQEKKEIEKELIDIKKKQVLDKLPSIINSKKSIKGIEVYTCLERNIGLDMLRNLLDRLKERIDSGIILLISVYDNKVGLLCAVTEDLVSKGYNAGVLVRELAKEVGGSGGGRPDMAQAGGKDVSRVNRIFERLEEVL